MKKLVYILFFLTVFAAQGQHAPLSTAYIYNGISFNPGYCGSLDAFTAVAGYRYQWVGIEGSPQTSNITFHGPLKKENIALGLQFQNDRIGITSATSFTANYAYRIITDQGKLSFGLGFGGKQVVNDWSKTQLQDDSDPNFSMNKERIFLPEFSAGLMFYNHRLQVGVALPNLLGNSKLKNGLKLGDKSILAHASYKINFNEIFSFHPLLLFKYLPASGAQADFGGQLDWRNKIAIGGAFRTQESFSAFVSFRIKHSFLITYAYDKGINDLSKYNYGSQQIVIRYNLLYKIHASNPRFF